MAFSPVVGALTWPASIGETVQPSAVASLRVDRSDVSHNEVDLHADHCGQRSTVGKIGYGCSITPRTCVETFDESTWNRSGLGRTFVNDARFRQQAPRRAIE